MIWSIHLQETAKGQQVGWQRSAVAQPCVCRTAHLRTQPQSHQPGSSSTPCDTAQATHATVGCQATHLSWSACDMVGGLGCSRRAKIRSPFSYFIMPLTVLASSWPRREAHSCSSRRSSYMYLPVEQVRGRTGRKESGTQSLHRSYWLQQRQSTRWEHQ